MKVNELDPENLPDYNDDLTDPGFFQRPVVQYYQIPLQMHTDMSAMTQSAEIPDWLNTSIAEASNALRWTAVIGSAPFLPRNLDRDLQIVDSGRKL